MKLILSICLLISGFLQLPAQTTKSKFAIAIHGGAGVISKSMPESVIRQYYSGLEAALKMGKEMLEKGEPALNVVEAVVRNLEDNPLFNAGKGAVFTADGTHELDAAIMDGKTLSCGAVACKTTACSSSAAQWNKPSTTWHSSKNALSRIYSRS